jgi:hypothetical protein
MIVNFVGGVTLSFLKNEISQFGLHYERNIKDVGCDETEVDFCVYVYILYMRKKKQRCNLTVIIFSTKFEIRN